jgi:hypothetical protein
MTKSTYYLAILVLCSCNSLHKEKKVSGQVENTVENQNKEVRLEETFETFFAQFNSDSLFQKSRTKFPLKATFLLDVTDEGSDSTFYVQEKEFFFVQLTSPKTNLFDGVSIVEIKGNAKQKQVILMMEDSGVHIEYLFKKIRDKWMLISYYDMSS